VSDVGKKSELGTEADEGLQLINEQLSLGSNFLFLNGVKPFMS